MPFEKQFGHEIGASILAEHEKNGVKILVECNTRKMKFEGNAEGQVQKVVLEGRQEIPADLVIIGAGITPNNELAKSAGLTVDSANEGIKVNPFMQTSDPNIFAAGDIASVPHWYSGSNLRIEHWIVAQDQGSFAAFNMLGKMLPYGATPFFWTMHYGKGL